MCYNKDKFRRNSNCVEYGSNSKAQFCTNADIVYEWGIIMQRAGKLSLTERETLQNPGRQLREISELPVMETNRNLWRAVNDGKMIRPVLVARDYPVCLLSEGPDSIHPTIEDPYWQRREMEMKLAIYEWKHMPLDRVIEPYIEVPCEVTDTNVGLRMSSYPAKWNKMEGLDKAYAFNQVLFPDTNVEELIKMPCVTYHEAETRENYERMCEIMDGIIDVKLFGINNFRYAMFDDIFAWTTIDEGMYYLIDEPELLQAAAKRYTQCFISRAKQYEALGILSSNNNNSYIGNGGYGYSNELAAPTASGIGAKLKDIWGVCQDQIFTSVSPQTSHDFAFVNEKPWADMFPRIYYGCCERTDHKVKELGVFDNLRKFTVSPFANQQVAMEKMGSKYVVSFKPNSVYLNLNPMGEDKLRTELENVCKWAREYNNNVEIVMKTIVTLNHEPQRLWRWCEMATDIIKNY